MAKIDRRVRVLICNLHATSNPRLIIPWLLALCWVRRIDVVCLQECTPRHAARLGKRWAWRLGGVGAERVLVRRKADPSHGRTWRMCGGWMGHHTRQLHADRTLPSVLVGGWVRVGSVHMPPAWERGPADRQAAGGEYLESLEGRLSVTGGPLLLAGDWNARRLALTLRVFRRRVGLAAIGSTLDHAAFRDCQVTRFRRLGKGPGQDHHNWLIVVEP